MSWLRNKLLVWMDPEVRAIARIIRNKSALATADPVVAECDKVFQDRLKVFPVALKMRFWERHFELDGLQQFSEIGGRLLDFGCGSGHMDVILARRGYTVHGIDLSPVGIAIADRVRLQERAEVRSRVSFSIVNVIDSVPDVPLFDSCWSAHVFEHIAEPGPILTGLRRWVKPGGYCLISVPLGNAYDDPGHVNHFYSGTELELFLNRYITVSKVLVEQEHQVIRALCRF